jgi:hypothetical protein
MPLDATHGSRNMASADQQQHGASEIFHTFSSNLPHMHSWIDELLELTKKSQTNRDIPTTDALVDFTQRYNAVFKELLRQAALFNLPLSQLIAKAWTGTLKLLDHMIKTYHKHVRETSQVQGQAQQVLREKLSQEAAVKNREEESVLERTVLRARIRGLEAEMEAMKIIQNRSNNENRYLRLIVEEYIRSSDANGRFAELHAASAADHHHHHHGHGHHGHGHGHGHGKGHHDKSDKRHKKDQQAPASSKSHDDDAPNFNAVVAGFGRKNTIEAGRVQLRELNRIEVEMGSILGAISKEEDRQRLIVQDLRKLVQKNPALFGKEAVAVALTNKNVGADTLRGGVARPPSIMDAAVQVDEKDALGALNDLDPEMVGIVLAPAQAASDPPPAAVRRERLLRPPPNIAFLEKETTLLHTDGSHVPYKLRRLMRHFPRIQRIPPIEWLLQTIMSIYVSKIMSDLVREGKGLRRLSLTESVYQYFIELYGIGTVTDVQISTLVAACEFHRANATRVTLFAHQLGLFDKEGAPMIDERDTQFILKAIKLLVERGQMLKTVSLAALSASAAGGARGGPGSPNGGGGGGDGGDDEEFDFGADGADVDMSERDLGDGGGVDDVEDDVDEDGDDGGMLSPAKSGDNLDQLLSEPTGGTAAATAAGGGRRPGRRSTQIQRREVDWSAIRVGTKFATEIGRAEAVDVCRALFEDMLTEGESLQGLSECIIKLKTMQGVGSTDRERLAKGKASKYISVDEFLMVLLDPWDQHVRRPWRDHMQFLFKQHCVCFKLIQEATFASDQQTAAWDKDAVLNEVSAANAKECIRRPLRPFDGMVAAIAQQHKQQAAAAAAAEFAESDFDGREKVEDDDDAALGADSRIGFILRRRRQQEDAFAMLSMGDPKKGAVCELLTKRGFEQVLNMINPSLTSTQVEAMYDDAVARSHEVVLRSLERIWRPLYISTVSPPRLSKVKSEECDRVFYVNIHARTTQWTRPFRLRTFHCQDVNIEDFVATLMHHDCFALSPLMELFRIRPRELWPNIDIFAKQTLAVRNGKSALPKPTVDTDAFGYGGTRGAPPPAAPPSSALGALAASFFAASGGTPKGGPRSMKKKASKGTLSSSDNESEASTDAASSKQTLTKVAEGEDKGGGGNSKKRKSKSLKKKSISK